MKKFQKFKKKVVNYLFDHYKTRTVLSYLRTLFFCVVSGVLYGIGYSCFVLPPSDSYSIAIATGGVSGLSQNFVLILRMILPNANINSHLIQSIAYFAINIPLTVFAFFKIGKKFAIFSILNVGITSLMLNIMPNVELFQNISKIFSDNLMDPTLLSNNGTAEFGGLILRIMFAAVCSGGSTAIAFRGGCSCGGSDIFSYYFSLRKSTGAGKYSLYLNAVIVSLYAVLTGINLPEQSYLAAISLLLSVLYLGIVAVVIDLINVRNKKVQLQIITEKDYMSTVLISNFTHSATVLKGHGAYSKKDKYTIYMVVPTLEAKEVIALAQKVDEKAFISVTSLVQVYGNFFIRPVE